MTEINAGWDSCVGAGAGDYLKCTKPHSCCQHHSTCSRVSLLNHTEPMQFLVLVCTALQNPSRGPAAGRRWGCDRQGLPLGKQACAQCQKWGGHLCELNPVMPAATVLRHQSLPLALRCWFSVPSPSEDTQNSSPFLILLLFLSPTKKNLLGLHLFAWTVSSF